MTVGSEDVLLGLAWIVASAERAGLIVAVAVASAHLEKQLRSLERFPMLKLFRR